MANPLSRYLPQRRPKSPDGGIGIEQSNGVGGAYGVTPTGRPPLTTNPYQETGVSGTGIFGGFVQVIEKDPRLVGQNRWRTVSDMLANVSIVAASTRFFLNLCAQPDWTFEPAEDLPNGQSSDAAKAAAELVTQVIEDMATPWTRVCRKMALFRFHGFGIHEWTAKKRDDGLIGLDDIESRPQHTIERWQPDDRGTITGVWQRSPQNGKLYWIPRAKTVYLLDDTLTDSPEGMGLFRHMIDTSDRIQRYLKLEGQGYERDLRGVPLGRAPIAALNKAVSDGTLKKEDAEEMLAGLKKFVQLQVKIEDTGMILDSSAYQSFTGDGQTVSTKDMWGLELLTGPATSIEYLGAAITRLQFDLARIVGTEVLMIGESSGSRALSQDKSKNLYLNVNSTVDDIKEGAQRDLVSVICMLNNIPPQQWPKAKVEDVAFKDVEAVTNALKNMALAGAVLSPDDPAINDVRALLGISPAPDDAASGLGHIDPDEDETDEDNDDSGGGSGGDDSALKKWLLGARI
jgi:hypothetical protein